MFNGLNTSIQGNVGLGIAIGTFCKKGWIVSIPLNDTQIYDLVVDFGQGLKTVQVKTTRRKVNKTKPCYIAAIKRMRYNRSDLRMHVFDSTEVDYLYIVTEQGTEYFIPSEEVKCKTDLTLNEQYDKYKI